MRQRIPIYIDNDSMVWIANNNIYSRNLEAIFRNRAELFLDLTEEEIDEMYDITDHTNCNVISIYLSNRVMVAPKAGKDKFEIFHTQYEMNAISEEFNGYVFILNIPTKKAETLREKTGVWIMSLEEIDDDCECFILEEGIYIPKKMVTPGEEYDEDPCNGWIGLLERRRINKLPPFNEVLVYDNYLNQYWSPYNKDPYINKKINKRDWSYAYIGIENLLILFDAILPKVHTNPIKIVIVVPKQPKVVELSEWRRREYLFEKRIIDWIDEVKNLRCYTILISCILIDNDNKPVHPRVLYTNYFYFETEKGFKIFDPYPFPYRVRKDGDSENGVKLLQSLFFAPKSDNTIETGYNHELKYIGKLLKKQPEKEQKDSDIIFKGDVIKTTSFSLFEGIDFED